MKKILTLLVAFVLLTSAILVSGDTKNVSAQTGDLVSQLPAADAVATVNIKRLYNDVMPQLLSAQPTELAKINAKLDEFKTKTGVDLRQLEQVAVAMNFKFSPTGAPGDGETLMLLRGNFNAAGLLAAGKIAANGKFRQEQIAGKNVMIFTIPETAQAATKETGRQAGKQGELANGIVDKSMSGEFAVYVVDANTIAAGKLPDVRSFLGKNVDTNRVAPALVELVNRNPGSLMSFAGNVPTSAAAAAPGGNDQIGRILKSLRQMFGSVDLNTNGFTLNLAAKTSEEPQAQELEQTLLGLQMIGKGMLGGKADEKNQVISRVVENLKITRTMSEVQLQATVPQADLEKLAKGVK